MVVQDGELDVPNQERFLRPGDAAQFCPFPASAGAVEICAADLLVDLHSRIDEVLLFRFPADGDGRRQLLLAQDDQHVVCRTRDRVGGLLIRNVEEYQRIARDRDFKAAVGGGNGADLVPGHAQLI